MRLAMTEAELGSVSDQRLEIVPAAATDVLVQTFAIATPAPSYSTRQRGASGRTGRGFGPGWRVVSWTLSFGRSSLGTGEPVNFAGAAESRESSTRPSGCDSC